MNYTKSNSYTEHAGTGQRMHDASKAIPTQVSDSDLNMIIWSLMEVIKGAGLQGVDFSADSPDSYKRLLQALQAVYAPLKLPTFVKRDADLRGGQISLQAADNQGYGDLRVDFHGGRVHLYAARKSDGKTVGGYIDLAQIGEGFVCLSDAAPAGIVGYFAGATAPAGWMLCNGAAISRTVYSRLFAAIGTRFGAGDGSTTFALPDLRGVFLRGLDGGRGMDGGRAIGTYQEDAMQAWTSEITYQRAQISGSETIAGATAIVRSGTGSATTGNGWTVAHVRMGPGVNNVARTAAETRPKNVALLPCVKY